MGSERRSTVEGLNGTTRAELRHVLNCVKAATGYDGYINHLIIRRLDSSAFTSDAFLAWVRTQPQDAQDLGLSVLEAQWELSNTPNYTGSLEAVVRLIERHLPEAHWRVEKSCEYPALSGRTHQFTGYCGGYSTPERAEGSTPALALLAAFLEAIALTLPQSDIP